MVTGKLVFILNITDMTKHLSFLLVAVFACASAFSQERFTKRIQQVVNGKGTVVLYQDPVISDLVDGVKSETVRKESSGRHTSEGNNRLTNNDDGTSSDASGVGNAQKVRVNGFRIQVYAGGNSREAKNRAEAMERKVKAFYPELEVYTRFVSPRWICHLGDFTSREQAMMVLEELRSRGGFKEAIIVKSKVNSYVY